MEPKPRHKHHRRFSPRNQVMFFSVSLLLLVLALMVGLLWLFNRTPGGAH